MLSTAFKEWAVICRALGEGRQALILRKGGIAELSGEFQPEHRRFLLYPTHYHEKQRTGIKPELSPLLEEVEAEKPPQGIIRFTHFAEVTTVFHFTSLEQALAVAAFHGWTEATVRQRFDYRTPGLFGLAVRVYRLPQVHDVSESPEYAGCKSWVQLNDSITTDGAIPVLNEAEFASIIESLSNLTSRSEVHAHR